MIALLGIAWAAEGRWDVSVHLPMAEWEPVQLWRAPTAGSGSALYEDPARSFGGGVRVTREWMDEALKGMLLGGSVDYWSGGWDHAPLDFSAQVWDVALLAGWRSDPLDEPQVVEGWVDGGISMDMQLMVPAWYPSVLFASPGAWIGTGLAVGRGAVRPTLGFRAGFTVGGAREGGAITSTVDDFSWEWHAGRAWVRGEAGVAF